MIDRTLPFLLLLLNQCLNGLVFLFGLLAANGEPWPPAPVLVALAIWAIPDLVCLGRSAMVPTRVNHLFAVVMYSVRRGWLALVLTLLLALLVSLPSRQVDLSLAAFFAVLVSRYAAARELRRRLAALEVLR